MKIQSSKPEKKNLSYYFDRVKRVFRDRINDICGIAETLRREFRSIFSAGGASASASGGNLRQVLVLAVPILILLILVIALIAGLRSCANGGNPDTAAVNAPISTDVTTQVRLSPEQLHAAYPQNLVVIGDSIASGYHLYEFIPEEHGLASGNAAIRSLHDYTYTYNGRENMDVTDIIADMKPAYILMSMGMNDINLISAETYTATYQEEIEAFLAVSPDSDIVVAAITPIEYANSFVPVTKLIEYNTALEQMVQGIGRANVVYFDAFNLLADPSTLGLKSEFSAGDGIHLSTKAYETMLNALYPLLDTMPYPGNNIVVATEPAGFETETTVESMSTT